MNKVELLDKIIELRHVQTLISNFIDVKPEVDGRIRTNFSLVETGRLSSHEDELGEGTHLQNVPVELRKMFVADPNYIFVEADKSQGEARIVAWLAHEERLKRIFINGGDIHKFVASIIFSKPEDTISKDERYVAKRIVHASNYGMGARKLASVVNSDKAAQSLGLYLSDNDAMIRQMKYFNAFSGIKRWQKEVKFEVAKNRRLTNCFGRKRYFFDRIQWIFDDHSRPVDVVENDTIREAYGYIPQSSLVDDVNKGLIELFYRIEPRGQILLQGHDSILIQCRPTEVDEAIKTMKGCLERPFWCGGDALMIPVEFKVGSSWGEMEEIK